MKLAIIALSLLSGCAMFGPPQGMNADQLKAYASDKNSSAICWTVLGPGWTSHVVAVNLDETRYAGGSIVVNPDCMATITSEVVPKAPAAPRSPSPPVAVPTVPPVPSPAVAPSGPVAVPVSPVTYGTNSEGLCIRTERDATGRVVGSATVDRARCQ